MNEYTIQADNALIEFMVNEGGISRRIAQAVVDAHSETVRRAIILEVSQTARKIAQEA